MSKLVILGTAHGSNVAGKCSPDKRFREYQYSREICNMLHAELTARGIKCTVDITADGEPSLAYRTNIVNKIVEANGGPSNCIYVSIHVNAAGSDGKWHNAGGWCAFTTVGTTKADALAECLYESARVCLAPYADIMEREKKHGTYSPAQRPFRIDKTDGDCDLEANFWVLRKTTCPAVLTENLFQDNTRDVAFLTSDEGKAAIVKLHADGITKYLAP
ncbi:N-acetylmuramoyl-L-alanine amidase [Sodaliphilus sp.]|uniref:N-acetylmuramoyl-L-alanine amidase n=1 Tax=Sodaliphilus sp. TaxID=2815818 RepID=UPI003890921A